MVCNSYNIILTAQLTTVIQKRTKEVSQIITNEMIQLSIYILAGKVDLGILESRIIIKQATLPVYVT